MTTDTQEPTDEFEALIEDCIERRSGVAYVGSM